MGVTEHLIALIKSLYTRQEAAVKTEYGNTEWFEVRKGVRQGCILSPYLLEVGGRTINNLTYTDDTTVLAEDKEDLKKLLKKIKEKSEKAGLMLNLK
jgi:hypothetical protein